MRTIWDSMTPPLRCEDVVKLAVGPVKAADLEFSEWEGILAEMITGDAFGADRMDYLLRDSHHIGVAYGRFDHYRLIDTLRILPARDIVGAEEAGTPVLGLEEGGQQSAEALLLARYFMYSQVYFHPVRRIYDIHLMEFLREWLDVGTFSTDLAGHSRLTDNEVTAAFQAAAADAGAPGHIHADRIVRRRHFKWVYGRNPTDLDVNLEAGAAVHEALCEEFGAVNVRHDRYQPGGGTPDFPIVLRNDEVVPSTEVSEALSNVPGVSVDSVFVEPTISGQAMDWLNVHRADVVGGRGG